MDYIVICLDNNVDVSGIPNKIKILPVGHVKSQKGDFQVDEESFRSINDNFVNRKIDLVIDYEHQTLKDIQAPAAGWITALELGEDAIIATVKWTEKAKDYLKNSEYRYLSPVVMVRKLDQKAISLHSVALTNTPAIDGMYAIVNSININLDQGGRKMDFQKIVKLLDLPDTATEEDVLKILDEMKKAKEGSESNSSTTQEEGAAVPVANSTILGMLNLEADAKTDDVAAAIMGLNTKDTLQADVLQLKQELQERKAEEAVELALKSGKITSAQQEWAKGYALKDLEGFRNFVEKAPVVIPMGRLNLKDAPELPAEEADPVILKNCGIDPEIVKKYYKGESV